MKEKILIIMVFLLVFPVAFSITQDPRTLNNVWFYTPNYTNCLGDVDGLASVPLEGHCENTWFFLYTNKTRTDISVRILPAPDMDCYHNNENCPMSGFQTNMTFKVSRLRTHFLWFSFGGRDSNHSVDIAKCWNWWNTTDFELRQYQKSLCPVATISFKKVDRGCTIVPLWSELDSPSGTALPDAYMSFQGYGGTIMNMDERLYNRRGEGLFSSIRSFMNISLSLWRILYYIVVIIFILTGIFFVIGVLPMGIKWIIEKVTED